MLDSPPRALPLRALGLSVLALTVPVLSVLVFPDWTDDQAGVLVWLTALVPAFLLTYYRGWQGASLALAVGMAVLSITQVVVLSTGLQTPNWTLLMGVVVVFLVVGFGIGWLAELLHRERRAAELMALTDSLTGLPNRRHAQVVLDRVAAAAERGHPLTVVLFDLDHFKKFNDEHGHQAGDEVLRLFGQIIQKTTRRTDVGARFGGEEFLSVLWGADARGAGFFLARTMDELARTPTRWGPISVSGGVATYSDGWGSPDLLLAAADRALYQAKAGGRGCFYLAAPGGYTRMDLPEFVPADPVSVARRRTVTRRTAFPDPPTPSRELAGTGTGQAPHGGFEGGVGAAVAPEVHDGIAVEAGLPASLPPGATVVLVEPDAQARSTLSDRLTQEGLVVVGARDPEHALSLLDEVPTPPALLVTDVIFPDLRGMSGFALADRLLARNPELRVLYTSRRSPRVANPPGSAEGLMVRFVPGPVGPDTLALEVRAALLRRTRGGGAAGGAGGQGVA